MTKCIALIPARAGSKSIPQKNALLLGEHPLMAYSIVAARLCPSVDEVIVSTDSEDFAEVAERYGAVVPFLRPEEISRDESTDKEWMEHFLDFSRGQTDGEPELIVHLRPTTPFREPEVIEGAVAFMKSHPDVSSLRSMSLSELTPYKMFMSSGGEAKPFMTHEEGEFYNLPRQAFPRTYIPNGVVDVLKASVFRSTGMLHGERMKIWETAPTADIDAMEDYEEAVRIFESKAAYAALKRGVDNASKGFPLA